MGDGQLAMQLGDLSGNKGWGLWLIRLTACGLGLVVFAACVVSKARARRCRMFRMMALAVGGVMGGAGAGNRINREAKIRAAGGD